MIEGRKLSFVRVYSGRLEAGSDVYNPGRNKKEKLSRILKMHANKRERVDSVGPGAIVGVLGLKDSSTGETLCRQEHPVLLETMDFYEPVISVAVEPKTHSDQEKFMQVLEKFMAEDPTLRVREDPDTGQVILSGMGELHLEIITSRMQREFNTQVNVGKPQVVYRETIETVSTGSAVFDKEVAGNRHYAEVTLKLEPLPRGEGNRFASLLAEDALAPALVKAVEKGVMESLESGILMGYPVVDVKVTLTTATARESGGTELAFTVAASMAIREALAQGGAFLLDPIMAVEVIVPEDFMGEVIGDLNARGGKIEAIQPKLGVQIIKPRFPWPRCSVIPPACGRPPRAGGPFPCSFPASIAIDAGRIGFKMKNRSPWGAVFLFLRRYNTISSDGIIGPAFFILLRLQFIELVPDLFPLVIAGGQFHGPVEMEIGIFAVRLQLVEAAQVVMRGEHISQSAAAFPQVKVGLRVIIMVANQIAEGFPGIGHPAQLHLAASQVELTLGVFFGLAGGERFQGLFILAVVEVDDPQVLEHVGGHGVAFDGPLHMNDGIGPFFHPGQRQGVPVLGHGVVGFGGHGLLKMVEGDFAIRV